MNISRRSILFSFIIHASLVCAGTTGAVLFSDGGRAVEPRLSPSPRLLKVTPVVLSPPLVRNEDVRAKPREDRNSIPARRTAETRKTARPSLPDPTSQDRPSSKRPETAERRYPTARPAVPLTEEAYPKAVATRSGSTQRTPGGKGHRTRQAPSTAPLWNPDTAPEQPSGSPTPSETPPPNGSPTSAGDQPGGEVSGPSPIGVIDPGLDVSSLKALTSSYIEVEFELAADGKAKSVRLLQGTGDIAIDRDLVAYFQTFRWNPKRVAGVAVEATETMDFLIENKK